MKKQFGDFFNNVSFMPNPGPGKLFPQSAFCSEALS